MKDTASRFRRRALALAVGTSIGLASIGAPAATSGGFAPVAAPAEVDVFVQLSTPSVGALNGRSFAATGKLLTSAEQRAQAERVSAEQRAVRPQLQALGARELHAMRVGANGLSMRVRPDDIASLKRVPGVISVARIQIFEMANVESVPWIGATAVNQNLGLKGEGVTIGVIDSGVDYTHANFGGPGTVAAYTGNNKNVVEAGTFPTAKVVGGYDFAGPTYNPNVPGSVPAPDPDPIDGNGHGSHVAGSATGLGVTGLIGPGVAPAAKLYALKVFNDTAGSTGIVNQALEWAMDPNADGDMSDHLDVINMSLGSPYGEPEDPTAIATANALAAGIIVVTSTGNNGNLPYVASSPGVVSGVIATAANVPGARQHARFTVNAPAAIAGVKFNEEGTSPTRVANSGVISDTLVEAQPLNGCAALTNGAAVTGNIVLIQRGVCSFAVKAQAAFNAGARALVLANNGAGDPITAGGITALIPGVMVGLNDGNALIAAADTTAASAVQVTIDLGLDPTKDDRIAVFSSRGPSGGGSGFKPDLSAPGVAIISTGVGQGNGPAPNQGTSMASPHTAGSAVLLHQKYPGFGAGQIKALLQNSTVDGNGSSGGDTSLARHGVGALRVDRAVALSSFAAPGGISFGRINPTAVTNRSEALYLENMVGGTRTFNVTHRPRATYPGVTVTCPSSVTVGPRGHSNLNIKLRFDPKAAAQAGAFDNAAVSQTEVDGWCILDDGKDSLRVGYIAVVDAASNMVVQPGSGSHGVSVRNKGPAIGFAEGFTLVNSGGEGADSNSYGSITHLGVRRADPAQYGGLDVMEFGIVVDKAYETAYNLDVDLFLDIDRDGVDDVQLQGRDWTDIDPNNGTLGQYLSLQFSPVGGFIDWLVNTWDYNDRVIVLPFTMEAGGGFVPESFNYRLTVQDRQGNTDEQTGTIDLADEVVPDLNSFGLEAGESVKVNVTGSGNMLWLFPTNNEWYQEGIVYTNP